jgi:hypothetical protein
MANGITIAGKGTARLAGKVLNCTKIDPTPGKEKTSKMVGMGGVAGDKVEDVAPTLELTVIVTPDVSLTWLGNLRNVDADVAMADGRSYTFIGASVTEPPKHTNADGTADVKLEAMDCVEH